MSGERRYSLRVVDELDRQHPLTLLSDKASDKYANTRKY
jgi:hypothetical protein